MKLLALPLLLICFSFSSQEKNEIIPEHLEMVGPYATPQEVTLACIGCHEDQAEDLSHSRHWNWLGREFVKDGKTVRLGKQNMLNNFCINIRTNEARCTSCHVGFGWKDDGFDFTAKENMDCLVCHDQTGTYEKFPTAAGFPIYKEEEKFFKPQKKTYKKVDFVAIAQSTAKPTNRNCGTCHFYGGGGHNVKHGDLTSALINPSFEFDVHMGNPDPEERQTCASCHKSESGHDVRGALHSSMAAGQNSFSCLDCHEENGVHNKRMRSMLNMHAKSISCETCHIPEIAKQFPTKTWWDWSTAGDKSRKPAKDANGKKEYSWKKGDFKWEKNLKPELAWHNGLTGMYLLGEKVELHDGIFTFNPLQGAYSDPKSRISAFKIMRGKQYIDSESKMMLVPHLFGKGGYWSTLDWDKAFADGMAGVGLPYSGKYEAVETQMYWPVFHMVAPADQAPSCVDCHTKDKDKPGLIDWEQFGYPGDPVLTGQSRLSEGILEW